MSDSMVMPGAWIGLLGGGQLGRMFTHAAQRMGYKVLVLDPGADCPASQTADDFIQAAYTERSALDQMLTRCQAVTTEFENVPATLLAGFANYMPSVPPAQAVAIAQDRRSEKNFFAANQFPVGPFHIIESEKDLTEAARDQDCFPGILKTARGGYDGLGQITVWSSDELRAAWREMGAQPAILEKRLILQSELSILAARTTDGQIAHWPAAENQHRNGILDLSIVPARQPNKLIQEAVLHTERLLTLLDYVGVLAVEFFVHQTPQGDKLALNEIAPRPHNSGHHSIESCHTSQFEQQVRTVVGMPLGDTTQHTPAVMVNLLGDCWFAAPNQEPDFERALQVPGSKLHLYGKAEARKGRKMGHLTCLAPTLDEALDRALQVKTILRIPHD
jgi:5-(carboxyamino)imidazole ribonucleotide synthase